MSKEEAIAKVKEILAKDPLFKDVKVSINFTKKKRKNEKRTNR